MKISDCLNVEKLQELCTRLYEAFQVPHGIMDNEGNWVVSEGWKPVCTQYFRNCRASCELCKQSDARIISRAVSSTDDYTLDTCDHGLEHVCYPIIIDGNCVGTFWMGQFFYEVPDLEEYRKMSERFSFDTEMFLDEVKSAPVVTRERIDTLMKFFIPFVELLTDQGYESLKRREYESELVDIKQQLEKRVTNLEKILPICSFCKKIRTTEGEWEGVDYYLRDHFKTEVSHGLCPDCLDKYYPEYNEKQ